MDNTENKDLKTPDEYFKSLGGFFDFLKKGSEISDKRKEISAIIEKHSKQIIEEILQFIYKDTYDTIHSKAECFDYQKIIRNAFSVPYDLLKEHEGDLIYHCVDKPITKSDFKQVIGRSEDDFVVYDTFKVNTWRKDATSIIFVNIEHNTRINHLIFSFNSKDDIITIYCSKDFPNADDIINRVLDFSGFKDRKPLEIKENEKIEDDKKCLEAIEKMKEAAKEAEEVIKASSKEE